MEQAFKIAIPLAVQGLFTYMVRTSEPAFSMYGRRVLVDFHNKYLTGVIIESDPAPPPVRLKQVLAVVDERPVFSSGFLRFVKWVAEYYVCPVGEVIKAALPDLYNPHIESRVYLRDDAHRAHNPFSAYLELHPGATVEELKKSLGKRGFKKDFALALLQDGIRVEENIKEKKTRKLNAFLLGSPPHAVDYALLTEKQKLAADIAEDASVPLSFSEFSSYGIGPAVLNALIKKGIGEIVRIDPPGPGKDDNPAIGKKIILNADQLKALDDIRRIFSAERKKPVLLYGVTGSGKTAVYLELIEETLAVGKSAIVLVPEIALTPQYTRLFTERLGTGVAVMHSKLSDGARLAAFRKMTEGTVRVVIGARSAVFAPLPDPGLIIVDEEHDANYKQDSPDPRYNARDIAVIRGKMEGADVLLGSGTPSLESYQNMISGKYGEARLPERADGARLPDIEIVDMAEARKSGQAKGSFSLRLLDEIAAVIGRREGVILLQNRRGYSSFLECSSCGYIPKSPDTDVALTYHKTREMLICHYTGYTEAVPPACPSCGADSLEEFGTGTQKVDEELAVYLADCGLTANVERVDQDSTRRKGSLARYLEAFDKGEIDVLVGTQMISKGLDLERVALVGVINADIALYRPDFRAAESAFQLLTQVAGRAGRRKALKGKVLIQSYKPDNEVLKSVASHDTESFLQRELKHRRDLYFPPFTRVIKIEIRSESKEKSHAAARQVYDLVRGKEPSLVAYFPIEAAIFRLQGYYRYHIILKSNKAKDREGKSFIRLLGWLKSATSDMKGVSVKTDVDSYSVI